MAKKSRRTRSTGNVFIDIGVDNPAEYLAKVKLAARIQEVIQKNNCTQKKAAEMLGIDQPKVSRLVRGFLDEFSTERLLSFLNKFGYDVEIRIIPTPESRKEGRIKVAA